MAHAFSDYDRWKLATPPEYEDDDEQASAEYEEAERCAEEKRIARVREWAKNNPPAKDYDDSVPF